MALPAALLVAALLHALVLLLPAPPPAPAPPREPTVVRLVPRPPAPEPPPAEAPKPEAEPQVPPEPEPNPEPERQRPLEPEPPVEPVPEPAPESPAPPVAQPGAPRRERPPAPVDLFSPQVIQDIAAAPPDPNPLRRDDESPDERVRRRLKAWDGEIARRTRHDPVRSEPGVSELGQRLVAWFTPPTDAVRRVAKPVSWRTSLPGLPPMGPGDGGGNPAAGRSWAAALQALDQVGDGKAGATIDPGVIRVKTTDERSMAGFCFGGCGQDHEVAALHVVIEVDHDEMGRPTARRVVQSSGDGTFDNSALSAIDDAATFTDPNSLAQGTIPLRSQWMFSAGADRWSRMELLLDPQFSPAGREVEELSGIASKTVMTTTVRLVAVVYRRDAPPPTEPPPQRR